MPISNDPDLQIAKFFNSMNCTTRACFVFATYATWLNISRRRQWSSRWSL